MKTIETAASRIPPRGTIARLRAAAADCRACHLWKEATQTVFGEGSRGAVVMLIGEQPGDSEDRSGHPFVGPAGGLLDKALAEAGFDRKTIYVTNVVKHFKWEPRGKRRIHKTPNAAEITACQPWLEAEIAAIKPQAIICLGSTAARVLLGPKFRVTVQRATAVPSDLAPLVTATVHPSSILRARGEEARHQAMRRFVDDLKKIRKTIRRDSR